MNTHTHTPTFLVGYLGRKHQSLYQGPFCSQRKSSLFSSLQYFEQVAEKPTYPGADSSLPSPLEGDNPMGEVSENEGLHNQDKMACL